jgi:hypothetical protein
VAELGQEELDLFVGELSQLRAEDVMNSDMIRVSSVEESVLTLFVYGRHHTKDKLQKGKGSG